MIDGDLPENLKKIQFILQLLLLDHQVIKLKLASSKTNADNNVPLIVYGGTKLKIESRVSDKNSGDVGSPFQFDSTKFETV